MIGAALLGGSTINGELGALDEGGSTPDPQLVRVVKVTDGDTIRVRFVSGAVGPVRYIGIDTPETEPRDGRSVCFADRATEANARLVEGKEVRLVQDVERKDRYDRLLAYVFVGTTMVNEELVRGGFARPLTVPPNVRFAQRFRQLAEEARTANRGLWATCAP